MSKKTRLVVGSAPLTQSPFASLSGLAPAKPTATTKPTASAKPVSPKVTPQNGSGKAGKFTGKIVVRRESRGRSGKTVTVIEGLKLDAQGLDQLGRDLRAGLGCGGSVEGGTVILSGDQRVRAEAWLLAHGAREVVIGN